MNKFKSILPGMLFALAMSANAQQADRKSYIVQLADAPAAGYTGQVRGYAATKPAAGSKLKVSAANVQAYVGYLANRQSSVLATVASAPVTYRYTVAFNGFAARLTAAEVAKLKANSNVVSVTVDEPRTLDTSRTPAFVGVSASGGLWSNGIKGEDVIIGVVDGGITPENPSFSHKVDAQGRPVASHLPGTVVYGPAPAAWSGACAAGPGFPATACNTKLLGARKYDAGFLNSGLVKQPVEFDSPRDVDGHGSHTSSTAGGNAGVSAVMNGLPVGSISGIAPRARIAAYKVCWLYVGSDLATCFPSDSIAAIDQAVADGVDVINFSISGTRTNFLDGVEVAFFFASDAGVFVAASAGNNGPGNTVAHMSPWLTTVAASTHDRLLVANAQLGNAAVYTGPSLQNTGLASAPLILATEAGAVGASPTAVRLCFAAEDNGGVAALDPVKIAGKIVVCDRGTNARTNKSLAVKAAGGVGMLLTNTTAAQTLNGDAHFVPTVHLASSARDAIYAYAAGGAGTASLGAGSQASGVVAPVMADFSSRGPNLANSSILKPDITAPGVDVLAAYSPDAANAGDIANGIYPAPAFDIISGTSMSSPHVAGMGALMRQAHRTWSPAAIKSALMTTSTGVKLANGAVDTDRFGYGAGHANPNAAVNPGLVYDAGTPDYLAFLCGQGLLNPSGATCQAFGFISPWNLNLASLTSDVLGRQTMYRTVRNVSGASATYSGSVAVPGFTATVTPSTLTLAAGAEGSFAVALQRTTAPFGAWSFGDLVWTDGVKSVRSPVTARSLALSAPAAVEDTRASGTKSFSVATGYAGSMKATPKGLVAATRTVGTVVTDELKCDASFSVPAGTQRVRVALFDSDTTGKGADDLDLEVYRGNTLVGSSGGATAEELVNLVNPVPGTYTVCVVGFAPKNGSSTYTLSSWVVSPQSVATGSFRVAAPTQVATGGVGSVAMLWSVPAGQRYFGTVQYTDGAAANLGSTTVYVDTVSPVILQAASSSKAMLKAQAKALQ